MLKKPLQATDIRLIKSAQNGDLQAFETIVVRYQANILNFTYRKLNDHDNAQDATQETFIRAFKNIKTFDTSKLLKTWLFAIAKNYCNDYIRKNARVQPLIQDYQNDDEDLVESLYRQTRREGVIYALVQVPAIYREPLVSFYWNNSTYAQIASQTNVPLNTIRTRIRRGRQYLAKLLKNEK